MAFKNLLFMLAISIACHTQGYCKNVTNKNSSEIIDSVNCGFMNITCGFGKVCREGVCIDAEKTTSSGGRGDSSSTETTYEVVKESKEREREPSTSPRRTQPTTKSHSLISGNQEFAIGLVGFSVLFINFCLVCFCLGRMKRRRLEQQRQEQRRQAATRSSQASQTGDWNSEHVPRSEVLDMGIENFALNGDLDAFSSDFIFPQVHLPPYDFSSAYHKPRPMTEEEMNEGESSGETSSVDIQNINEDPPPYSDQQLTNVTGSPPSYDEALKVLHNTGETSS